MTKEMYKKCLNEKMEIFGKLPEDVQDEIRFSKRIEYLDKDMMWRAIEKPVWRKNNVYRIDPSTPYEQEFVENVVYLSMEYSAYGIRNHRLGFTVLCNLPCIPNCLGIIYEKDGVETLRTSVDLSFGTPKRVRFAK